jgi:hypothetical protein
MFEMDAVPHSYIPWVQIGLSIALCVRILLLVVSADLRPSYFLCYTILVKIVGASLGFRTRAPGISPLHEPRPVNAV